MKKLTVIMAVIGCVMAEMLAMNISAGAVNTQAMEATTEAMVFTEELCGTQPPEENQPSHVERIQPNENLKWHYENHVLTISGEGIIDDYDIVQNSGEITSPWGQYAHEIETVIIEEGITSIGMNAFSRCENLTSVRMPDTLTKIRAGAFSDDEKLEKIVIPDSVTAIEYDAFNWCFNLKDITLSKNLVEVDSSAFSSTAWYNELLREYIDNSENNANILMIGGDILFKGINISGDIVIPDGVRVIAQGAFSACEEMTSVTIPDSVKHIQEHSFSGCGNLKSITIPEGITEIRSGTFQGCGSLEKVNFPDSITSIGNDVFAGCQSLTEMTFPENVKTIGIWTFHSCKNLKSVTYPASVEEIGKWQFEYAESIEDVTILNPHCRIDEQCKNKDRTIKISENITMHGYPYSTAQAFAGVFGWNFVPIIEKEPCSGDYGALHWDYADHVLTISGEGQLGENDSSGYDAPWQEFSSAIRTLIIEDGVTEIGTGAFNKCQNITSVSLPDTLTKIGHESFAFNTSLKSIVIPDSVTEIETGAFINCYQLKEITLSKNLVNVGESSLAGTAWYDDLEMDENSLVICGDILFKVYADGDTVIPDGVRVIGNGAFTGVFFHNEYTTSITIPDSVKYIGNSAFGNCDKLESITISKNVEKIGKNAFSECDKLTSITILNPNCEIEEQSMISSHFITKIYGYPNSTAQTMARNFNCIFVPLESEPQNVSEVSGDANGDGTFSLVDVVQVHKMLQTRKAPPKSCDMNKDNKVNVIDLSLMKQKLFK